MRLRAAYLFFVALAAGIDAAKTAHGPKTKTDQKSTEHVDATRMLNAAYEPTCDTTRAQRDAMRAAFLASINDTFSNPMTGALRQLNDVDPQGESIFYNFFSTDATAFRFRDPPLLSTFYNIPTAQDAIVLIFCLPPVGTWEYFGVTDYAVMFDGTQRADSFFQYEPNAELGDSLNHLRLNTTAPEGEEPWGYTSAIIHTPDQTSAEKLTMSLELVFENQGLPKSAINVQVIPSLDPFQDLISFGQDLSSTVFFSGIRVRSFINQTSAEQYANYEEPVLLVSNSSLPANPIPTPDFIQRGSDSNEKYLLETQNKLKKAVIQQLDAYGYAKVEEKVILPSPIMDPTNCWFRFNEQPPGTCFQGSQDISYGVLSDTEPTDPYFVIVIGAIHSLTGFATYSSIGYNTEFKTSFNSRDLQGSVDAFFDGRDPESVKQGKSSKSSKSSKKSNNDLMYILRINPFNVSCDDSATSYCFSGPGTNSVLTSRATLDPNTETGPLFADLVQPIVMTFAPKGKAPKAGKSFAPKAGKTFAPKAGKALKSPKKASKGDGDLRWGSLESV